MMTIMDRSILYQINSLEKPQKISGFLKEKGYSRQNLVDLRKDEQAICLNGTYVHMNHMLAEGDVLTVWIRETDNSGQIRPVKLPFVIVYEDEDLLVIPNVAIHMNRGMNDKLTYNPQTDLQPLLAVEKGKEKKAGDILMDKVAQYAGVKREDILGKELFLYVREKGRLAGASKELIISPRLDDLACAYGSLKGFLKGDSKEYINVYALFDKAVQRLFCDEAYVLLPQLLK